MEDMTEKGQGIHSLIFPTAYQIGERYDLAEKNTALYCKRSTILSLILFHYSPLNSCSRCVFNGK